MSSLLKSVTGKGSGFAKQCAFRGLPATTILTEAVQCRFFHSRKHAGLVRRDRRQWKHHAVHQAHPRTKLLDRKDLISSNFRKIRDQTQMIAIGNHFVPTVDANRGPPLFLQTRYSSTNEVITDEVGYKINSDLHEQTLTLHMHPRGPILKLLESAQSILKEDMDRGIKILDIGSISGAPAVLFGKEYPRSSIHSVDSSPEIVREVQEKATKLGVTNVTATVTDMNNKLDFQDSTFDLVTSCYGLEQAADPNTILSEIHRVLKPGGTLLTTVWRHCGTDAIMDAMMKKVTGERATKSPGHEALVKPFFLEDAIHKNKMWVLNSEQIQYHLQFATPSESHGHAFDLISLPLKKTLGQLVSKGTKPYAFEDANSAFEELVNEGNYINVDAEGGLTVEDNHYKFVVARRRYEDDDVLKGHVKAEGLDVNDKMLYHDPMDLNQVNDSFKIFVSDAFSRMKCSPWKQVTERVHNILRGHDMKKVQILDLSPYTHELTAIMAKEFPDARVDAADLSSEEVVQKTNLKDYENGSIDVVTSSFGFASLSEPGETLKDIHRVLRPGGSFVSVTWDSISLERIAKKIIGEIMGSKYVPSRILHSMNFSEPLKLERLITSSGLAIHKVDHVEFPFYLSDQGLEDKAAFDSAAILIRPWLESLEETRPHVSEDARRIFQKMMNENKLVGVDAHGKLLTVRNRCKIIVARRKFEDSDGILQKSKEQL